MRSRGFTLIELLVCAAMVAILATAALPLSEMTVKRQKEQQLRRALHEIRDALDAYKQAANDGRIEIGAGDSGYPPSLDVLVQGLPDRRNPKAQRLYFLRRIPRDPFTENGEWGLRSYESPPEDPAEGDDVYDVYSLSPAKGINGVPYREW
jgi:general secretion pathway protein G